MDSVRDSVIRCLYELSAEDEKLIAGLNEIVKEFGIETCSTIIHVLTHLELEPIRAKESWGKIITHREKMSNLLKRKINLRTAICDYFCSIDGSLKNPKVVEISVFEDKDKASKYDNLTGLFNRNFFDDYLSREIARAKRYDLELSILFFDLDDFKKINDSFGHLAGDAILKSVSTIIIEEVRTEDLAARYGGEELVVVLPQTGKIRSLILGERIREKIEEMSLNFQNQFINLTVSAGLASYPEDADDADNLLKYADHALYEAKSYGKNNIVIYSKHKRRYLRINLVRKIQIENVGNNSESTQIKVNSKNFSKAGILFESSTPFAIGDRIRLTIPLENEEDDITVSGSVVRIEVHGPDRYDIGVSFIEMDKVIKSEISRLIMKHFERIYA